MNNKGMTLVELIVTFSLLMIIIVGMFNLIMDVKGNLDDKKMAKELTEYSSTVGNQIQYDLIRRSVISIGYKDYEDGSWTVLEQVNNTVKLETLINDTDSAQFSGSSAVKTVTELNEMCKNIFPCVVYSCLNENNDADFKTIAINIPKTINPSGEPKDKFGIYYDSVFEALPYQENVDMSLPKSSDDDEKYVSLSEDMFSMNIPIKIIDQEGNYGFKVVKLFSVAQVN